MKLQLIIGLCCLFIGSQTNAAPTAGGPVVSLPQGDVEGVERSTANGVVYQAFLGIPYGKANRFEAPVAAGNWIGTFDGTQDPEFCYQPVFSVPMGATGTEDCLTLSVFTPSMSGGPYKVRVFIHGGAFFMGDNQSIRYGPERIFDYTSDEVLVLIQYRLGALGFLSTGDSNAPGNFGLMDQNLALKWVQSNIEYFNGDPDQVILHGESAGAVSVSSHLLSPKSSGLFMQAVLESGSALVPWGYNEDPLQYAQNLGSKLSCDSLTNAALISCLKGASAEDITVKEFDVMVETLYLAWVPVVDGDFIPDDPATLYANGDFNQVPIIQGFNRDEGAIVYMFVPFLFQNIDDAFFNDIVPLAVRTFTDFRTNLVNISYAIKDEYYNIDLSDAQLVADTSINFISDMIIKYGSVQTIQSASKYVPVYMYEFNYQGSFSESNYTGGPDITHAIELTYLYNNTASAPPLNSADEAFAETFVKLWSDFDLKGNPTPAGSSVNWPQTPAGQTKYFSIDKTFSVSNSYDPDRMKFWLETVPSIANA